MTGAQGGTSRSPYARLTFRGAEVTAAQRRDRNTGRPWVPPTHKGRAPSWGGSWVPEFPFQSPAGTVPATQRQDGRHPNSGGTEAGEGRQPRRGSERDGESHRLKKRAGLGPRRPWGRAERLGVSMQGRRHRRLHTPSARVRVGETETPVRSVQDPTWTGTVGSCVCQRPRVALPSLTCKMHGFPGPSLLGRSRCL